MAEDGRIIIDTKINTDGVDIGEKEIRAKLSKVARNLDLKVNLKSNEIDILREKINSLNDVASKNRDIMIKKLHIPLNDFIKAKYNVELAEESISSYKSMLNDTAYELEKLKIKQEAYNRTLSQMKTSNIGEIKTSPIEKIKNSFVKLNSLSSSLSNNLKNGMSNAFKVIKTGLDGISSAFSSLGGRFLRIINYQVLRKLARAVIDEFIKGIADLEAYSGKFGNTMQGLRDSLKNLGNSIVTAFAPIIQALAPAITWLIGQITKLFNTISMFTTALFSNSKTAVIADTSFSGYGKKVEKLGKATKKAKKDTGDMIKALAKFDKLDVLNKDKKKDDVGGGASADIPEVNPAMKMFKEVSIPNNIFEFRDKIINAFDLIRDKFKTLANSFSNGFSIGFKDNNLDVFREKLVSIKNTMFDIFNDTGVVEAFNRTINSLSFNLGKVVGSMASVGVSLGKMLVGGFEKFLSQNKERIKKLIIDKFNVTIDFSNLIGRFAEFIAEISTMFGEDKAQSIYGNFLSAQFNLFDVNFQNIYKLAEKTAETLADPFIENVDGIKEALDGMLTFLDGGMSGLNSAFEGLGDSITSLVEDSISPTLDVIKEIFGDIIGVISNSWNNSLKPVFEDIGNRLKPLGEKIGNTFRALAKPINSVFTLIVNVYNKIKPFLEKYVYPLFGKILTYIGSGLGNTLQTAFDLIETLIDNLSSTFSNLSEAFSSMVDIISDIINGDWKKLWEDAGRFVKALARGVLGQLKTIPDLFVNVINMVIRAINNAINLFNGIGFGDFKINIPNIPQIPKIPVNFGIPGLATGTVVSPGREFLARLGDNTREKEVVSPISTMKQAFSEALNEYGGVGGAILQLDGETFARLINPYSKAENNRLGISMVSGV